MLAVPIHILLLPVDAVRPLASEDVHNLSVDVQEAPGQGAVPVVLDGVVGSAKGLRKQ